MRQVFCRKKNNIKVNNFYTPIKNREQTSPDMSIYDNIDVVE